MDDSIQVGGFGTTGSADGLAEPLHLRRIRSGGPAITVMVRSPELRKGEPVLAGPSPCRLLRDTDPDDDVGRVEVERCGACRGVR